MFKFEEIEEQIKGFATRFSRKANREARPYSRPSKDSLDAFFRFELFRKSVEGRNDGNQATLAQAFTNFKKHSSLKLLEDLRPTTLNQMQVNKVHYGTYLVCRTVKSGFYFVDGLNLLIEDEMNEIENVRITDYTPCQVDPDELFPPGNMFIIKEPFLKSKDYDPTEFYLRVDSPSDIIIITENILQSTMSSNKSYREDLFEQMNREGNTYFVAKRFYEAVTSYSKALTICENDPKVLTNLAAAYLHLEKYNLTFLSAQKALEVQESEKAHYRMAKSAYMMRQFQTAVDHFEKCLKINSSNQQAKEELEKSRKRLRESKTGKYDMKNLIEQFKNNVKRIDVADFVHSSIEITEVQGKNKGVKAKKPIKRGTLLVCSKAFSIAYLEESQDCPLINVNSYTQRVSTQEQSQNLKNLIHKMLNDPKNAEEVYKLYAGKDIDRSKKLHESIIDVYRIEAIQTYNSFTSQEVVDIRNVGFLPKKDNTGLWIFPSYFNHSCMTNTKRMFLADLMLIYASQDIEQDEEITISYFGMENYSKRQEICEAYGFNCKCKLCKLDKNDEQLFNREAIVEKSKAEMYSGDLSKRLKIVERVKNTYKKRKDCQFSLLFPLTFLARSYLEVLNFQESIKVYTELFEMFKDYDMDSALLNLLAIAQIYAMLFQTKKAQEAVRRAYDYYVGGKDLFIYKCHVLKFDMLKTYLEKL